MRGKRTLAESLDSYVSKELMDGQNQYHSEELGKNVRFGGLTCVYWFVCCVLVQGADGMAEPAPLRGAGQEGGIYRLTGLRVLAVS